MGTACPIHSYAYHLGSSWTRTEVRVYKIAKDFPGAGKKLHPRVVNSEPRNEKIFNIFALVKIGERSGAGLSDLYRTH